MSHSQKSPSGRFSPLITLLLLVVLLAVVLSIGALVAKRSFDTRGLPKDLPEPIAQADFQVGINTNLEQYSGGTLPEP